MTSTTSTRDALLAALRDSPHPLSTTELATLAPWHREYVDHHRRWYHEPSDNVRLVICAAGVFDVVDFRQDTKDIYRQLKAMAKARLVRRVTVAGMRQAYWAASTEPEVSVGQLEAMWSA